MLGGDGKEVMKTNEEINFTTTKTNLIHAEGWMKGYEQGCQDERAKLLKEIEEIKQAWKEIADDGGRATATREDALTMVLEYERLIWLLNPKKEKK